MKQYTCKRKIKENGIITKLVLEDKDTLSTTIMNAREVKALLLAKEINIDNITLDVNGRFVTHNKNITETEELFGLLNYIKTSIQKDKDNIKLYSNILKEIKEKVGLTHKDIKTILDNVVVLKQKFLNFITKNNDNFIDLQRKQIELSLELQQCQQKLDTLLEREQQSAISNATNFDKLERILKEQNKSFETFDKEMKEKVSYLFSRQPRDFYGVLKYPRPETDIHKYNSFYDKDLTLDIDSFNTISKKYKCKAVLGNNYIEIDNPFLQDFEYNETNKKVLDTLRMHVETVHLIRDNMETIYHVDLKSERTEKYDQRLGDYYTGFMASYGGFIGGLAVDIKNVHTDKDGNTVGNFTDILDTAFFSLGILMGIHFIPYMFRFINIGTKHLTTIFTKNDRYRIGQLRTIEERDLGSYNYNSVVLTVIDNQDLLLQDENTNTIYGADIRMFVINSNNLKVKRNILDGGTTRIYDALKSKSKKDELFYKIARGSLCNLPIESDRLLMKFYVDFYLSPFLDVQEKTRITDNQLVLDNKVHISKNVNLVHKDISVTESNVNSRKVYFDLFCNAYFSAKRLLNFNIELLNYLDGKVNITQTDTHLIELYLQFLRHVYFGLIMQSLKSNIALDMIKKFLETTSFSGSDIIINILFN